MHAITRASVLPSSASSFSSSSKRCAAHSGWTRAIRSSGSTARARRCTQALDRHGQEQDRQPECDHHGGAALGHLLDQIDLGPEGQAGKASYQERGGDSFHGDHSPIHSSYD